LRALAITSALLSNLHAHSASLLVHSLTCLSNIGGGMLLPLYAPQFAHCPPSVPSVSCRPVVMTIKAVLQSGIAGIVLFDIHKRFDCHLYLEMRPTWSTRPLFLPLCMTIPQTWEYSDQSLYLKIVNFSGSDCMGNCIHGVNYDTVKNTVVQYCSTITTTSVYSVLFRFLDLFFSVCACRRAVLIGERSCFAPRSTYSQGSSMPLPTVHTPSGEDLGGPVIVPMILATPPLLSCLLVLPRASPTPLLRTLPVLLRMSLLLLTWR